MPRTLAAIISILVLGAVLPADAQDTLDDARAQREELQREAAITAAQIDELNAEDEQIVAALAEIDAWIALQQAQLAEAEQKLQLALERQLEETTRAAALDAEIATLEALMVDQLVDGYIEGFGGSEELLLQARDINSIPILRFVIDEATGTSLATGDLLRLARSEQETAIEAADDAAAQAAALALDVDEKLAALDASRADQQRLRDEVNARIGSLEDTASVLAEEDARIADFIRAEEERIRLEEEARRRAEEERRRQVAEQLRLEEEARQAEQQRLEDEQAEEQQEDSDDPADDEGETREREREPQPSPPDPGPGTPSFSRPIGGPISSPYGFRIHPIYGTRRLHTGIDYHAGQGAPIAAAASGTVIFAGSFSGYGNTVIVQHSGGYSTLYAHMSGFNLSNGASVNKGETVGFVGSTGLSTGPHLHFEIRLNGTAVDPAQFL
ncbi:MAG: peptidoglycan DD-metalloendopeptidase family protein [Acidimicrobiales bacterium]